MDLALHANATTTPRTRAYIQRSKKPVAELAGELGVSETTIRRWRGRTTVSFPLKMPDCPGRSDFRSIRSALFGIAPWVPAVNVKVATCR